MHPKDRQPPSFDEPVANGNATPWRRKVFTTSDPDELAHHFNTKASATVERIVPLDSKIPFAFTRAEIDFGRIRLTQGKSTAFHMVGHSTCLTLNISETGSCIVKGLGKGRATEIGSHRGDNVVAGGGSTCTGCSRRRPTACVS